MSWKWTSTPVAARQDVEHDVVDVSAGLDRVGRVDHQQVVLAERGEDAAAGLPRAVACELGQPRQAGRATLGNGS